MMFIATRWFACDFVYFVFVKEEKKGKLKKEKKGHANMIPLLVPFVLSFSCFCYVLIDFFLVPCFHVSVFFDHLLNLFRTVNIHALPRLFGCDGVVVFDFLLVV